MNYQHAITQHLRAALAAIALTGAMGAAHALDFTVKNPYLGAAAGSTDGYGTGLRLYGGAPITNIFGWEAALTSFGSETYARSLVTQAPYERSAWAFGGMATARFPLNSYFSAFGKLGAHYYSSKATGPGVDEKESGLRAGIGAGLLWHFTSNAALRVEVENIGGANGDLFLGGFQFSF